MSFKCESCKKIGKSGEKPVRQVVETKLVGHYQNLYNPEERRVEYVQTGTGTQIVRERDVCKPCAGSAL